jgi:hypothetical protein
MDRAVATEIMDILAAGQELAQIMGLYTDLIVSVAHQYPDLDPDSPAARASESRT